MRRLMPIFSMRDMSVTFDTQDGPVEAVKSASFDVFSGETLAIVGEVRLWQKPDDDGGDGASGAERAN